MPSSRPWPAAEPRRLAWLACLAFASAAPSSALPSAAGFSPEVIPQAIPQLIDPDLADLAQAIPRTSVPLSAAPSRPAAGGEVPQLARDEWKDCQFNLQTIGCRDEPLADGLRIIWRDGIRMDYRRPVRPLAGMPSQHIRTQVGLQPGQHPGQLGSPLQEAAASPAQAQTILADRLGGLWRRQLLIQGNTLLTNLANGNRILVPLRFPCRPPLRGEVGYCH